MSYSRTLLIGWYIEYKPSALECPIEPKQVKFCSSDAGHKLGSSKDQFCPRCGGVVMTKAVPQYRGMQQVHHMLNERSQEEITYGTLGRGTVEDIAALDEGFAVFPEFMDTHVLMLPGYAKIETDGGDGFSVEVDRSVKPDQAYIELARKVFDLQDVVLKYGAVMDVR